MHKINELCDMIEEAIKREFDMGIQNVDTDEMGKVVDMYKDLMSAKKNYYEAKYYESIVDAMEEYEEDESKKYYGGRGRHRASRDKMGRYTSRRGYDEMFPMYDDNDWTLDRDMDRDIGKMYYTEKGSRENMPMHRDAREGRSGMSRKGFMESKELKKSEAETKKELEDYMRELGSDIAEMVSTATPAEKTMLKQKMTEIQTKIV